MVRNWRVLDAFEAREADDARRATAGLGARRRKRRRRGLAELASAGAGPKPRSRSPPRCLRPLRRLTPDVMQYSTTAGLDLARPYSPASGKARPAITVTGKCEDVDVSNVKTSRAGGDDGTRTHDPLRAKQVL